MRCFRSTCSLETRSRTVDRNTVFQLLKELQSGTRTVEEVASRLSILPYEDLQFARVDHHRSLRSGQPEVVFAQGKTPEQTAAIFERIYASGTPALATRATQETFAAVQGLVPEARYHAL